jgi:hypothetical protein
MTTRRVFYSFKYKQDVTRVAQIRNIGAIDANRPATDNGWETITKGSDPAIKRWIDAEMRDRTCCVVLIGATTANQKWINYEIDKAWKDGLGVVGVHIHNLKALQGGLLAALGGQQSSKGANPFTFVSIPLQKKAVPTVLTGLGGRPAQRTGLLGALAPSPQATPLSSVVKVYDPPYTDSRMVYRNICAFLAVWIEEAIAIRKLYV